MEEGERIGDIEDDVEVGLEVVVVVVFAALTMYNELLTTRRGACHENISLTRLLVLSREPLVVVDLLEGSMVRSWRYLSGFSQPRGTDQRVANVRFHDCFVSCGCKTCVMVRGCSLLNTTNK